MQDKHEAQLQELINENRRQMDKLMFYDEKTKEFSTQIHALNEEKLMLLKEHEIMKSKLRTYEIDSTLNRGNGIKTSTNLFFDKIRGKLKGCQKNNSNANIVRIPLTFDHITLIQVETSKWKMKK